MVLSPLSSMLHQNSLGRRNTSFFEGIICGRKKKTNITAAAKTTSVAVVTTANTVVVVVSDLSTLHQQSKSAGTTLTGTTAATAAPLYQECGSGNNSCANTTNNFNRLLTSISTSFDVVQCIIVRGLSHLESSHSIKVFFYC